MLLAAMPAGLRGDEEEDKAAILELLQALAPCDPAEAQLAAIGVAAALASMDSFMRAARPGLSEDTVTRLRGNALAAGRTYAAVQRRLRKRPEPVADARPTTPEPVAEPAATTEEVPPGYLVLQPGAKPIPAIETFQPRDRFGKPIPLHRTDLMTRSQVLAALACPRDPQLESAAIAEERAMMAQQAQTAGYSATTFATSSGDCRTSAS
jgi:hypothetical protein